MEVVYGGKEKRNYIDMAESIHYFKLVELLPLTELNNSKQKTQIQQKPSKNEADFHSSLLEDYYLFEKFFEKILEHVASDLRMQNQILPDSKKNCYTRIFLSDRFFNNQFLV